jgi:hypothetical protein
MRTKALLLVVASLLSMPLSARTPAFGSPERKAILDALRPSIEAEIGPNVEFVVTQMNVRNGWAFIQAEPQRKGGRLIDWRSYYNRAEWNLMDGLTVTATLQFRNGRWNLIQRQIGATDAWYCGSAPVGLIPYC